MSSDLPPKIISVLGSISYGSSTSHMSYEEGDTLSYACSKCYKVVEITGEDLLKPFPSHPAKCSECSRPKANRIAAVEATKIKNKSNV